MQTAWQLLKAYFLGLLAKIKCSICSYDCEKSYGRHCLPDFHNNISSQGLCVRRLRQPSPTVFLALHSSLVTLTLHGSPNNNKLPNSRMSRMDKKQDTLCCVNGFNVLLICSHPPPNPGSQKYMPATGPSIRHPEVSSITNKSFAFY